MAARYRLCPLVPVCVLLLLLLCTRGFSTRGRVWIMCAPQTEEEEPPADAPESKAAAATSAAPAAKVAYVRTGFTPRFEDGGVNTVARTFDSCCLRRPAVVPLLWTCSVCVHLCAVVSMPLSPPAGKPKGIMKDTRSAASSPSRSSLLLDRAASPAKSIADSDSLGGGMSESFFGSVSLEEERKRGVLIVPILDSPMAKVPTTGGVKPSLVTRVSGRFGVDGDLDDDDELGDYALESMEVDVDELGLRSTVVSLSVLLLCLHHAPLVLRALAEYMCASLCKTRHTGRIHRLFLASALGQCVLVLGAAHTSIRPHVVPCPVVGRSYKDLAYRAGMLEPFDSSSWSSSLVCRPYGDTGAGDSILSPTGSLRASLKSDPGRRTEASPDGDDGHSSWDGLSGVGDSMLRDMGFGSGVDNDENDDGVPAEDDAVIVDSDDVHDLREDSAESAMLPVDVPPKRMIHHVEFGSPKAGDGSAKGDGASAASKPAAAAAVTSDGQISVAPDWFSSLGVGEPPYTVSTPRLEACVDYIWFTPVRYSAMHSAICNGCHCKLCYCGCCCCCCCCCSGLCGNVGSAVAATPFSAGGQPPHQGHVLPSHCDHGGVSV